MCRVNIPGNMLFESLFASASLCIVAFVGAIWLLRSVQGWDTIDLTVLVSRLVRVEVSAQRDSDFPETK